MKTLKVIIATLNVGLTLHLLNFLVETTAYVMLSKNLRVIS